MQNLYEVRKSVRFSIIPQFDNNLIKSKKSEHIQNDLKDFISNYEKVLSNFSQIVFNYNKSKLNTRLKIKFSFLKNYTKKEYYENDIESLKYNNKGEKKAINQIEISVSKLEYLFEVFSNFEKENKDILEIIKSLSNKKEESEARNSDLGYYFNKLTKRTNFEFIKELFNDNIGIENNIYIFNLIGETKGITQKLLKLILDIQKTLLPNESIGQVIEKASFNYYTVNKRKKYYEDDIRKKEDQKIKKLKDFYPVLSISDDGFKKFISNITDKTGNLKIEQAYNLMKEYKSEQKAGFLEFLSKCVSAQLTFEDLQNHTSFSFTKIDNETKEKIIKDIVIYLFDNIEKNKFDEIIEITNKINVLAKVKTDIKQIKEVENYNEQTIKIENGIKKFNELLKEDENKVIFEQEGLEKSFLENISNKITELKKARGLYFFEGDKTGKFAFNNYTTFCEEYKKVAIELGRIKAYIKSLEKEKVDAEKTQSWALILEQNNNKYLLTIPRNKKDSSGENYETNLQKTKKEIDNLKKTNSGELILYKFESLTLKALDKLCFGKENNSFAGNISKELFKKNKNFCTKNKKGYLKLKRKDEIGNKENKGKNDKNLIDFYKTVLSLDSTKKQIIIKYFKDLSNFIELDLKTLEDFERELKKTCYIKESFSITESKKDEIIKNFEAKLYKITSYDLQKNDTEFFKTLNEEKKKSGLNRLKTNDNNITNLWLNFWKNKNEENKYPIRLNPEISISYLEADKKFTQNNSHLKYNRKFQDRYLFTTTITENALEKSFDLSFKETSQIKDIYKKYNEEFNKNKDDLKYFYGFDRGENELVSLGVFDLQKKKSEEKGEKVKVYELKKDCFLKTDEKGRIAYKNLSYFQYDKHPNLYIEKEVSCIDLTSSKLINGKIYLNGDITTYLNLKLLSAKRKIYEYVSEKFKQDEKIEVCEYGIIKLFSQIEEEILEKLEIDKKGKSKKIRKYLYKFDERYDNIFSFEDTKNELKRYLKKVQENLSDNEEISIQRINNLRDAICANMTGIISFLYEIFPGMIILEDLSINWKNDTFDKSNMTLSSRFEQKLLQRFSSLNLVPPTYKQILSIKDEKNTEIKKLGIVGYVDETNTSKLCPNCGKKLFGHGKGLAFENSMHHYKEDNLVDYGNFLEEAKQTKNDSCNYHMKNNQCGFSFITSGDDLATYNIAKKGLEYINNL